MFSNQALRKMLIPLFFEQFLVMLVGLADTFIISYAGEAAVSGVSLVNMFNTIFIYLFTALAAGGAVVISQYIGNQNKKLSNESSSQLLMFSAVFSVFMMIFVLVIKNAVLTMLFGHVEEAVMEAAQTYLRISAYSYPALAVYNAGAALYRSMGKTSVTMYISIFSNVINVVGNCIGVYVLHAGVAGVAYPSLLARLFSAGVITVLCFKQTNAVYYEKEMVFNWNGQLLGKMLSIAIPNGFEQGVFQLVKVALGSVVALFGTYQIAANGIAQSIWSVAALVGASFSPVFTTVIGQCMGAGDIQQADFYFKKLMKWALVFSITWNILIGLGTPLMMNFYNVSEQTKNLVIELVIIHNIFNAIAFPFSGLLPSGLRACGDVKFTMYVSILSTVVVRLVLSIILGVWFNMGVVGIAFAMCFDWTARGIVFAYRFMKGAWKNMRVI
ncbi:MAG: MATE family efflux transporter [Firmicutes bacterium]|nr:MATE family efflux transporter [Bacillota bacterium]